MNRKIYTIGHSNRIIDDFIPMLRSFGIITLADVRSMPGSKRWPQYNQYALSKSLKEAGINYIHIPQLGGKQRASTPGGYKDYMSTEQFADAIKQLEKIAQKEFTAYMCAEADWSHCHRSFISDHLKAGGWQVLHILDIGKSEEHPTSRWEKPVQGNLFLL